jgi:hypothetical protein
MEVSPQPAKLAKAIAAPRAAKRPRSHIWKRRMDIPKCPLVKCDLRFWSLVRDP